MFYENYSTMHLIILPDMFDYIVWSSFHYVIRAAAVHIHAQRLVTEIFILHNGEQIQPMRWLCTYTTTVKHCFLLGISSDLWN